ncbi:MAG: hypothetical protein ACE5HR_07375, partial [bacterium]
LKEVCRRDREIPGILARGAMKKILRTQFCRCPLWQFLILRHPFRGRGIFKSIHHSLTERLEIETP